MRSDTRIRFVLAVTVAALAAAWSLPLAEETTVDPIPGTPGRMEQAPEELDEVGIEENLDAALPLDAEFRDERGNPVRLGDYFDGEKPVVLALVYYRCPMLCNLILDGLTSSLRDLKWSVGEEFEVVTVSFDPTESHTLAQLKKQSYLKEYGRDGAASGWHFLTGPAESIDRLTDTVGFRYEFVEDRNEYAHTAALFLITPDGRISRYLYGILYEPSTLRFALVEAGEGKVGSVVDRVLLYCFHYDADEGRYSLVARQVMKLGGGLMVVVLGVTLLVFWRRELRRAAAGPEPRETES
jgi:protein SCO1/2